MSNIILIGFRGVGKSTIAHHLGSALQKRVYSVDSEIEKQVGPIKDYVDQNGWDAFRHVETEVLKNAPRENTIVDCGGGIIEKEENRTHIKKHSTVMWLNASLQHIQHNLAQSNERPSLSGKSVGEEANELLVRRTPLYQECATHTINVENESLHQVVTQIQRMIQ